MDKQFKLELLCRAELVNPSPFICVTAVSSETRNVINNAFVKSPSAALIDKFRA